MTRQNTDQDMGTAVLGQLFDNPKALIISAGILLMMGLVPGMLHFAFLSLGALSAAGAWWLLRREKLAAAKAAKGELLPATAEHEQKELSWDDVMPVDIIGLEVGYQLIPLVDRNQGGELLNRIRGTQETLARAGLSGPGRAHSRQSGSGAKPISHHLDGCQYRRGQCLP